MDAEGDLNGVYGRHYVSRGAVEKGLHGRDETFPIDDLFVEGINESAKAWRRPSILFGSEVGKLGNF